MGVKLVMSKPYHLVIFDWEGTLGDTIGPIINTIAAIAKRLNYDEFDAREARLYVPLGLGMVIKKLFPNLSLHQYEQFLQEVQHYLVKESLEVALIPGAREILQQLKLAGIDLAIATNKGQSSLKRALLGSKLDTYFSITRSAGDAPAKPCPQMLEEILNETGFNADQALMVGDSTVDMEMAKYIGVDAIGFDYDHNQGEKLIAAGALDVFHNYRQLAQFLQLPLN